MIGNIFKTSFWNLFYDMIHADSNNYNKYTHNDQLILGQARKGQCHEICKTVIFHSLDLHTKYYLIMVHNLYSRPFSILILNKFSKSRACQKKFGVFRVYKLWLFNVCFAKQEILKKGHMVYFYPQNLLTFHSFHALFVLEMATWNCLLTTEKISELPL